MKIPDVVRGLLAVCALACLAGCFESVSETVATPSTPTAAETTSTGKLLDARRLSNYTIHGYVSRSSIGSFSGHLWLWDSSLSEVALRPGDFIRFHGPRFDTVSTGKYVRIPSIASGDTILVELVLFDSGTVFQAKHVVDAPPLLVPRLLAMDTIVEIDLDPLFRSFLVNDTVAVLDASRRILSGQWKYLSVYDSTEVLQDLRPLVRKAASQGVPDSVYLQINATGFKDFLPIVNRFKSSSLDWMDDFRGTFRLVLPH